jgi:glutathione peroxidase-family protein
MVPGMAAFHDFVMNSIAGDQVSFDRFRGQMCLVVNVASA